MKSYLKAFVNYKQINLAKLLPIAKFVYNNTKNTSISHTFFELNYGYHSHMSYEKDINFCFKLKSADRLLTELQKLIPIYKKNLHHTQELQKQAQNKARKPKSYAFNNKVWSNSKYVN